jgi:hypothetical protein
MKRDIATQKAAKALDNAIAFEKPIARIYCPLILFRLNEETENRNFLCISHVDK